MRLRGRGNQPTPPTPDHPVTTTEHPGPDGPSQQTGGMVPPPDAELTPIPDAHLAEPATPVSQLAAGPVADPVAEPPAQVSQPAAEPVPHGSPRDAAPTHAAQHVIHRTRMSVVWVGLGLSAVVLLLLLVFILENQQSASIGYFGAHGRLPLGVALLLAALAGALLVLIPGSVRILQLRKTARRHRRLDSSRG